LEIVEDSVPIDSPAPATVTVTCPSGKKVLGGAYRGRAASVGGIAPTTLDEAMREISAHGTRYIVTPGSSTPPGPS
jgi:hypothetical protein